MTGETWHERAWAAMRDLAASGEGFWPDDLVDRVGHPSDEAGPNGPNSAIGSMFRQAKAQGLIVQTGATRPSRQPRRKGGLVQQWQGVQARLEL